MQETIAIALGCPPVRPDPWDEVLAALRDDWLGTCLWSRHNTPQQNAWWDQIIKRCPHCRTGTEEVCYIACSVHDAEHDVLWPEYAQATSTLA